MAARRRHPDRARSETASFAPRGSGGRARRSGVDVLLSAAAWAALVALVVASLWPSPPVRAPDFWLHAGSYAVVTFLFLCARVRRPGGPRRGPRHGWVAVAAGLFVLGAAMEVLQGIGPRSASVADALANGAGITAGVALWGAVTAAAARAGPGR